MYNLLRNSLWLLILTIFLNFNCLNADEQSQANGAFAVTLDELLWSDSAYQADRNGITCVAWGPDGLVVTASHGKIIIWNLPNRTNNAVDVNQDWIYSVAFSHDGSQLAVGGNGHFKLFQTGKWETSKKITCGPSWESVNSIAFTPDGKMIAVGMSGVRQIFLIDRYNGKVIRTVDAAPPGVALSDLAFSPNGLLLAVGQYDETISLWDTRTWERITIFPEFECRGRNGLLFTSDSRWLIAGSHIRDTIAIWDILKLSKARTLKLSKGPAGVSTCSLSLTKDDRILSAGIIKNLYFWDLGSGVELAAFQYKGEIDTIAFSPDGSKLAFGVDDTLGVKDTEAFVALAGSSLESSLRDLEMKLDEELSRVANKDEFETEAEYKRRIPNIAQEQENIRQSFAVTIAEVTRQNEEEIKQRRSFLFPFSRPAILGNYDAEREQFVVEFSGVKSIAHVPREKARTVAEHKGKLSIEGNVHYLD